jgi:hypothetical protein
VDPARNGTPGIAPTSQALPSKIRPTAHLVHLRQIQKIPYFIRASLQAGSSIRNPWPQPLHEIALLWSNLAGRVAAWKRLSGILDAAKRMLAARCG